MLAPVDAVVIAVCGDLGEVGDVDDDAFDVCPDETTLDSDVSLSPIK